MPKEKDISVEISGIVLKEETQEKIVGTAVYLLKNSDVSTIVASTISDQNAQFRFLYDTKTNNDASGYSLIGVIGGVKSIKYSGVTKNEAHKNPVHLELLIPRSATLKLSIVNKDKKAGFLGIKILDYEWEEEAQLNEDDAFISYIQTHYGQTFYGMDVDTVVELPIPANTYYAEYISYQMINSDGSLKDKERAKINYTGSDSLYNYATFEY